MRFRDRAQQLSVFYQAQDASLRCISRNRELKFLLGDAKDQALDTVVRCRQLPNFPEPERVSDLRGRVDMKSVRHRFGVAPGWFRKSGFQSLAFHEALEQIRCEYLALQWMPGIKHNLQSVMPSLAINTPIDQLTNQVRREFGLGSCRSGSELAGVDRLLEPLKQSARNPQQFHQVVCELLQLLPADSEPDNNPVLDLNQDGEDAPRQQDNQALDSETLVADDDQLARQFSAASGENDYRVFDDSFDQVIDATEIAGDGKGEELRLQLDKELRASRISLSRLAGRLLTVLLANVNEDWEFEHEEGALDTNRLGGLIANPLTSRIYRRQRLRKKRDTLVTVLVDNSGSMRGQPIMAAALCTDMLTRTLERCGVAVEVLGFTTAWWRGGEARQQWIEQGKVANPGRLNGLRHIVYKSADRRWRHSRLGIAQMLEPSLLKENVDGEALEWAAGRMRQRPEARKILLLVSDGAPRDEATAEANQQGFLEAHLRHVIRQLEQKSDIELAAIGIGHNVSHYYKNSIEIESVGDLGETLVDRLALMLAGRGQSL